ncbi:MAG: TIGR02996 domain-containing protein [Kofleriaceae bacterium]
MTVVSDLQAAIRADVDDDAPRLVYADYLADHGDPRGELIQLHCALARDPRDDIAARVAELFAAHRGIWERVFEKTGARVTEWRRGFPYAVVVDDAGDFLEHRERWFATAPIGALTVNAIAHDDLGAFVRCEEVRMLDALALGNRSNRDDDDGPGPLRDAGAAVLGGGECFDRLRTLTLATHDIGPRGARELAKAAWLRRLTRLDLDANPIGRDGFEQLCPALPRLAELRLWSAIAPEPLLALRELRVLELTRPELGTRGAIQLAESGLTLESLVLIDELDATAVIALATAPSFRLHRLALTVLDICDAGLVEIARSPQLAGLVTLGFSRTRLAGARALAASTVLAALRELELDCPELYSVVKAIFEQRTGLPALERYELQDEDIPF